LAPDPIRLACAEVGTAAVDGDFKRFGGDVADSAVAVIDCVEAPVEVDAVKLERPAETALAAVSVRESDAARARSLVGACSRALLFKVYIKTVERWPTHGEFRILSTCLPWGVDCMRGFRYNKP
jgi:hypothetical protein